MMTSPSSFLRLLSFQKVSVQVFRTARRCGLCTSIQNDQMDWSSFAFGDDLQKPVEQPDAPKLLKVAVVGLPNTGKSTLVNSLLGEKVAIVSDKCQTTRESALTIWTEGNNQIVLIDTPGVVPYHYGRKIKMPHSLMTGAKDSLLEVDLALVVVDVGNKKDLGNLGEDVLGLLKNNKGLPSALVLNKVDLIKQKGRLLMAVDALTSGHLAPKLIPARKCVQHSQAVTDVEIEIPADETGWPYFSEVMMVSAATGEGVDAVKDFLTGLTYPSDWMYPGDKKVLTSPSKIVEEIVREKLLSHLYRELPYIIKQETMWISNQDGVVHIHQALNCNKESQKSIIIGPRGETIQRISAEAQHDLETILQFPLELELIVRVNKKRVR
eukprot:m.32970 g.32970  ORF g.32970 m.32970 type:complete len:381 (+) comp31735_c0_seq2:134-1276(+)